MGASLEFGGSGTSDEIDFGSASNLDDLPESNGLTVIGWVYLANWNTPSPKHTGFVHKEQSSGAGWRIAFSNGTYDGRIRNLIFRERWNNAEVFWSTGTDTIGLNAWTHIGVVYDGSSASNDPLVYINGVSETVNEFGTTPTGARNSDASVSLKAGELDYTTGGNLDGAMAYIQVHDALFTQNQVIESMYHPGAITDGMVLFAPCLSNASTVKDISGLGNDGTGSGLELVNYGPPVHFPRGGR